MIEVCNLTQYYGKHCAVHNLNFKLEKGKLTGFLGPNGAGKSTTLNLVTGYLKPTQGTVTIGGYSMQHNEMEAKALIGYLSEHPALYLDLTVEEYLTFVAKLKKVSKIQFKIDTEKAYSLLHLGDVHHRLIKNLSKGYRQRVGFAGSLVGNPPLLILDEPTVGLDPNQISQMRDLIKSLKTDHTIILSSHILSEIEAICDEALIIHKGEMVAFDTMERLTSRLHSHSSLILKVINKENTLIEKLQEIEGLSTIEELEPSEQGTATFKLTACEGVDIRKAVYNRLKMCDVDLLSMSSQGGSLEELFREVTGGGRDADNRTNSPKNQ
jgi:ABC-2 type transport system ATP-binding protein